MTELAGLDGAETDRGAEGDRRSRLPVNLDPTYSQRWARTVVECVSCGQAVSRRAEAKAWIHHATQLRFSGLSGPHLARPRLDTLLPSA